MSDPITNVEIEDVLSSIRRLVTEESRTGQRRTDAPAPVASRLVLTPALRVAQDEARSAEAPATAEPDPIPAPPAAATATPDPVQDAPMQAHGEPWRDPSATLFEAAHPELDEVPWYKRDTDQADSTLFETALQSDVLHLADPVSVPEGTAEDMSDVAYLDEPQDRAAILSAKIEALEAAIAETRDQWEPDGELGDDYAGTQVDSIAWEDVDQPGSDVEDASDFVSDDPDVDVSEEVDELALHSDDAEDSAAAQVQDSVEELPEDWDAQDDIPVAEDMMASAGSSDRVSPDEAILDEESLRELVADIVRQELQGALGERITRNVRKLVRREIHRALTAQELE